MKVLQLSTLKQSISNLRLNKFISGYGKSQEERYIQEGCYKISAALSRPVSDILELTKDADMQRFMFLESMKNHIVRPANRISGKDSEYITEIYSKITEPTAMHFDIVRKTNDSFETISKIFDLATDENSLDFVRNVQYEVLDGSVESAKIIIDMLSSKNKTKYTDNLDEYISYLKIHAKDTDAIKKLDNLITSGKYNRTKYDNQLAVQELMKNRIVRQVMAGKNTELEQNYSPEAGDLLKLLIKNFVKDKKSAQPNIQQQILDIYSTAGEKNTKLRSAILNRFKYGMKIEPNEELSEIKYLFERIDTNEDERNFVEKMVSKGLNITSIGELNHILDITPLKKAIIFFNNTRRIIATSAGEERTQALKQQLENPFFTPKHTIKQTGVYSGNYEYGFVTKMFRIVENQIDKFRYRRMLKNQVVNNTITPETSARPEGSKIKFARPKLSTIQYKIKLSEDVNNIIKNMLTAKTYEKQYEQYSQNATGMRLKMLPDIFNAIKLEAAEAKKQGKPSSITRKNALVLYKRINDRNRKTIRYMLRQTNKDGSKTFSFKNIISTIDEIETEIANRRKADKTFKYSDTKLVYAQRYSDMVHKYGKLGRNNIN